jgi:hypothetical protein
MILLNTACWLASYAGQCLCRSVPSHRHLREYGLVSDNGDDGDGDDNDTCHGVGCVDYNDDDAEDACTADADNVQHAETFLK